MENHTELFDKCVQSELRNRKEHLLSSYIPLVDCLTQKQLENEENESQRESQKESKANKKERSNKRKRVSSSESDSAKTSSRPSKIQKSITVAPVIPHDGTSASEPKLLAPKTSDVAKVTQNSSSSELSITPEPKDAPSGSKDKSPGLVPEFSDSEEDQKEPIKTDIAEAITVLNSTVKSPTKPMAKVKPQVRHAEPKTSPTENTPPVDQSNNSTCLELEKTRDIPKYPEKITCPKCETTVKSDQLLDLLKHIRIKHGEDDVIAFRIGDKEVFPYTCEECSYGFVNTSTLESHRVEKYLNKDYTKCKRYQKVVKKYKKRLPKKIEQEVISFETIARSDFQCPLQKCSFKSDKFIDIVGHMEHSHSPKQFIVFMTNGKGFKSSQKQTLWPELALLNP